MNDELLKENKLLKDQIEKLLNERKFGLVWENTIEDNETADYTVTLDKELSINLTADTADTADTAEHLFFEGDNLLSLRELQKTHKEKIDVIYIDPPYNTGNKFVYSDKLKSERGVYSHSAWLSFMEKRLSLAKNLLANDGVIFVSIDDNEHAQLKLLMDKVFGEENFISKITWSSGTTGKNDTNYFKDINEYIYVYGLNKGIITIKGEQDKNADSKYKMEDEFVESRGKHYLITLDMASLRYSDSLDYPIWAEEFKQYIYPYGRTQPRKEGDTYHCWRWGKEKVKWGIENDLIVFKKDNKGRIRVYTKQYEKVDNNLNTIKRTLRPNNLITDISTRSGKDLVTRIFGSSLFDYPKPLELIKWLLDRIEMKDALVLDFFAGSGTTGHAVMELNKEDGGNRQFILCTNNEVSEEKEREYLAEQGYIEKPHKRLHTKYKEEYPEQYKTFLNSEEYQSLGIARSVTRERLKRVIEGYTTPKGEAVKGLVNNKVKHYIIERTDLVE